MATVDVTLWTNGFDGSRLRAQVRGTSLLIMDRMSGRWIAVDAEWMTAFQLLGSPEERQKKSGPTARLLKVLTDNGVGLRSSVRTFQSLNTVILKLTAACNHACLYCYDFDNSAKARRLDANLAIRAVQEALALCEGRLQVILHGGEPMLVWPLIEEVVWAGEAEAERLGKRIQFVGQTNMSRLNNQIGRFSIEHDIVWGVSVDGPPDVHDHFRTYRNGKGTYTDFEAALRRYPRFVQSCGVLSTITTANHDRLTEVARHFRDLGMASWDWTLFQAIGRGRDDPGQFEVDADKVIPSWTELFEAVLGGEFDGFPVKPVLKYVDNFLQGPGANMCMRPECGAGRDLLSIGSDGKIEACDCIDPTGPLAGLGSLRTGTLEEARASQTAQRIRGRNLSGTQCNDCIWWGICGGGCMAHAPTRDEIPDLACGLALNAFDRVADELVHGDDGPLRRYLSSVGSARD